MMIGIVSLEDIPKIPQAYQKAVDCGATEALLPLARWFAMPDDGEPQLPAAEAVFKKAIAANVEGARVGLAQMRWFCKRETATGLEKLHAHKLVAEIVAANPQDAEALYFLALFTTHGFGVTAATSKGFEMQQRAADMGHVDAMFELYVHYAQGIGVTDDPQQAFLACQRAANAGHPRAMYNMGAFYAGGRMGPKDLPEAVKWYKRSADQGNPSAMANLALIYATGDGIAADRDYAAELLNQAESLGLNVDALREHVGIWGGE